jgi:putative nucleotidyltransferase with HDIG domain
VIHRDQALASQVLRVANSATFAADAPCTSLHQACSRLGMQRIVEIAMAVAVRGRVLANTQRAALQSLLWRHSILTGFYCKEIARLRRRNVETAFLCGLLHDIGRAVLLNCVDDHLGANQPELPVLDVLAAVHEHHVAAGALMAREWQLPEQIAEAIECHHDWLRPSRFQDLTMQVALADVISHHVAPSVLSEPVTEDSLRRHPVLSGLYLYPDQLHDLLALRRLALDFAEGLR